MDKRTEKILGARNTLQERVEKLQGGIWSIDMELAKVASAAHGMDLEISGDNYDHECETSPIGICAYDDDEDPLHDSCVFCHQPYERK